MDDDNTDDHSSSLHNSNEPSCMFSQSSPMSPMSGRRISNFSQADISVDSSSDEIVTLKHERKAKVLALVEKRKVSFMYLKRIHEGGEFWLNCVELRRFPDLEKYAAELPPHRITQLFYLGLSIARILQVEIRGALLVKSLLQLFGEWEYHFAGSAAQSVRGMRAKVLDHPFPLSGTQALGQSYENGLIGGSENSPIHGKLYKYGNDVVYEQLLTPQLPFALDYFEVYLSLCEIFCLMYGHLRDEECFSSAPLFEALLKVDTKVKRHILNVTAKDFTDLSANIARVEFTLLRY